MLLTCFQENEFFGWSDQRGPAADTCCFPPFFLAQNPATLGEIEVLLNENVLDWNQEARDEVWVLPFADHGRECSLPLAGAAASIK